MTSEHDLGGRPWRHDVRVVLFALAGGLPAVVIALALLAAGDFSGKVRWTLTLLMGGAWIGFALAVREIVVRPLQTISNMLAALQEGDYSIRARRLKTDDALGLALLEINTLGDTLQKQRLDAVEATALLSKVMEEIEVAIFTFDDERRLQLVNRGGVRLLARATEDVIGKTAAELNLEYLLAGDKHQIVDTTFADRTARLEMRRSSFREGGVPHQLVVITDLTSALRQEERQAWQRLVQVLRHEIGNSLAPIRSLAGTMQRILMKEPRPSDWLEDVTKGLEIISERSGALGRFMASYTQLTRLPDPQLSPLEVAAWVRRVAGLETRLRVQVIPGPPLVLQADGDQLDQLLINLVKNAVDASLETGGGVRVGWSQTDTARPAVEVWVQDDGPGLSNTRNLFVPFFTTKPQGSGIGLVLSRQIAEAHGGTLTLQNRRDATGCSAQLRLPV